MNGKITKQFFITLLLIVFMMFSLVGCDSAEDHIGEAQPPSLPSLKGKLYDEVIKEFKEKGFTNIQTNKLDDLVTGWMTKEGEVEKVSVGGDESYDPDKWVSNDTEVMVTYHAFPEDKSELENSDNSEVIEEDAESSSSISEKAPEDFLTVENNEELAKILTVKDNLDSSIKSFAEKYVGRIIEFDANIADIAKHKDYKTRHDILLYAGDYSETESYGPSFKFEDVSIVLDLNLTGDNIPDNLVAGQHVRVTVKIEEYRENSGLLIVKPITTRIR